jgi:hypothetical protein
MEISAKEWLVEREHYHSGWANKPQRRARGVSFEYGGGRIDVAKICSNG